MKWILTVTLVLISMLSVHADMKYHPISFKLSTAKTSYYEGEKITLNITITNTDKENVYPVLLPHTQNTGHKLIYLNVYDKANNTLLLRATENKILNMMVHDTGSVQIKYLQPLEEITFSIYLNDFENYYNYYTQNSSHHSFGIPLFAGVYKINFTYNPNGIELGNGIYSYYNDTDEDIPSDGKLAMYGNGETSNMVELKIKRSADTLVSIERVKYYVKTDGYYYYYFSENVPQIVTDLRCVHITNLPADSSSIPKGEYFYSHFTNIYAEFITRFENGDIQEYRKYRDNCPDEFLTERYNEYKQKYYYAIQLPDGRFYNVTYLQPSGNKKQEMYYSADGKLCTIIDYIYNKQGAFLKTKTSEIIPCIMDEL
jgi:hypothetical protein